MSLTNKQRAFVEEYLRDFNATQAAIRAGYSERTAYSIGSENLRKPEIAAYIQERIDEKIMQTDEILLRLSDQARSDMGDFIDIEDMFFRLNLSKAKELGLTHLIKKVKDRVVMTANREGEETETHTLEIELYDAKSALDTMAKYRGLLIDRSDITSDGEKITLDDSERIARAMAIIDAARARDNS